MALSQEELTIRLQQTGCCTGEEAKRLAQYYLYGSECAEEQLQKLTILNAYLDILSCYKTQSTTDTNWIYFIDLSTLATIKLVPGSFFNLYINGEVILNYTVVTEDFCTEINSIATELLNNENIISVNFLCDGIDDPYIRIEVTCDMVMPYFTYTILEDQVGGGIISTVFYSTIYTTQEGKCITVDEDNCITEDQIKKILENLSITCKKCFKPISTSTTDTKIPTRYDCIDGSCQESETGIYANLATCLDFCSPPPVRFSCVDGTCVETIDGPYATLVECQYECLPTPP